MSKVTPYYGTHPTAATMFTYLEYLIDVKPDPTLLIWLEGYESAKDDEAASWSPGPWRKHKLFLITLYNIRVYIIKM